MYKNKKVCSLLIAVAMLVTLIPFNAIAVLAAELSSYETSDGRKIESISAVGTVDIIESTGGCWETSDQGTFYRYDIMSTKPTVTITFDNGDVQTITYDQYIEGNGYNIENSDYRLWFDSYQSYENQWQVGENTAYVYLQALNDFMEWEELCDTAVEFKVNLMESPVESINVNGTNVGIIGKLHPKVTKEDVYVFEINLDKIKEIVDNVIKYFGCYSAKTLEFFTHNEDPWINEIKNNDF